MYMARRTSRKAILKNGSYGPRWAHFIMTRRGFLKTYLNRRYLLRWPSLENSKSWVSVFQKCNYYCLHFSLIDVLSLIRAHSIASSPSFTSRGFRYYHLFNMSLCGHPYQMARCHSNISLSSGKEVSNTGISVIRTPLCYEQFLVPKLPNFIQSLGTSFSYTCNRYW